LRLRLRLLLLQLLLLPLLFLGHVVPDGAAGHRPQHGMVARDVSGHGTHGSPLQATPRHGRRRAGQQCQAQHGGHDDRQYLSLRHVYNPLNLGE